MPDKKVATRIICEGGLDSTQNFLNLSTNKPGCATRLINYEVGLSGGYRRINGYDEYDTDFPEVGVGVSEGQVLGVMFYGDTVIAARKLSASSNYALYHHQPATGWVAYVTGLTHVATNVEKLRYASGNDGATDILVFVDGINNATLYNGTSFVAIDSADTGADHAHAGGDQAVNAPALVTYFKRTLFLAGDISNNAGGIIAYSAPDADHDWTSANGAGQIIVGFNVVDMKPFRDELYVFGENAIKKIVTAPDPTDGFVIQDVTTNIGCLARDSVLEIGGDLVFLAPDGFRPIAGTSKIGDVQLETISKPIHASIRSRITGNAGLSVNSVVIRGKSQFRMFFGDDNIDAIDSRGLVGALRTPDQFNGWEFGELLGFRASCCASKYIDGEEIVLHGDYDGVVYQQEVGNSINGSDLLSVYSTPYLDFGDTEVRKEIEKITTFLNGEGSIGINLGVTYDWGREETTNPAAYEIIVNAELSVYDDPDVTYGDADVVYGGILTPVSVTDIQGSFFSARFTFATSGIEAPHSIHAIVVEYALEGRR